MDDPTEYMMNLQRRLNPMTLAELKRLGANLTRKHRIVNVFYSNSEDKIKRLAKDLKANSFSNVEFDKSDSAEDDKTNSLECTKILIPELNAINEMTDLCVRLSQLYDCGYDGWYTEPVND